MFTLSSSGLDNGVFNDFLDEVYYAGHNASTVNPSWPRTDGDRAGAAHRVGAIKWYSDQAV